MSKTKTTPTGTTDPATDDETRQAPDSAETPQNEPETSPETAETGPETAGTGDEPAAQLAAVIAERDQLRRQVDRLTVAADTGVPVDLLTAGSIEELRQQADAITAYANTHRTPDFGAGNRGSEATPDDPDPLRTALANRRRR